MNTINQLIQCMETEYSDRTAFQYYDGGSVHSIRYASLVHDIRQCAGFLLKRFPGVEGKHIGICADSSYQYMVHFLAILYAKAVVVPLNPMETEDVLQYEIEYSDMIGIFVDEDFWQTRLEFGQVVRMTFQEYQEYEGDFDTWKEEDMPENRTEILLFTSGTTGRNKGVLLSQKSMFTVLRTFTSQLKLLERTMKEDVLRSFLVVPMYHVSGIVMILSELSKGVVINICGDAKYLYRDLKHMKSDHILVVPTILKAFYRDLTRGKRERLGDLSAIHCCGAMVDAKMLDAFRKHGITIVQAYGLTESFGNGTVNTYENEEKLASVGLPGASCEIRIKDGEVLIRGDSLMMGYYKNPEETRTVLKDGWLYTGDLGYLDSDGYLYLTGRKKNLIILSGGENVSPEELEQEILRCGQMQDVLVKQENDKICAVIYCDSSRQGAVRQHISDLNRKMPYYKRITKIVFAQQPLERTATGKLKR